MTVNRLSASETPERWKQISDIIYGQYRILADGNEIEALLERTPQRDFSSPAEAKQFLIEQEKRLLLPIDQVCTIFARQRTWPVIPPEQMLFLLHRMKQALDLMQLFALHPRLISDPLSTVSDSEILEFLLVDYWNHIGRERYLAGQIRHF
jgi:hypothetical protein